MTDKPFRTARLIRLAIFLGILFSFAWMFRWELGNTVIEVAPAPEAGYVKLDRWTGTSYHCVFWVIPMAEAPLTQENLIITSGTTTLISETPVEVRGTEEAFCTPFGEQQ